MLFSICSIGCIVSLQSTFHLLNWRSHYISTRVYTCMLINLFVHLWLNIDRTEEWQKWPGNFPKHLVPRTIYLLCISSIPQPMDHASVVIVRFVLIKHCYAWVIYEWFEQELNNLTYSIIVGNDNLNCNIRITNTAF